MTQPRVRPRFARPLEVGPAAFFSALTAALAHREGTCRGLTFGDGAILRVRTGDQRVWSPALHLHVEGDPAGPWQLHGTFTPSSPVWTAFIAIYLALACIATAAFCYGAVQWFHGEAPWALLGVVAALALAGFTYGAAFIGQGLGAEDMYELRSFVDCVAESCALAEPDRQQSERSS